MKKVVVVIIWAMLSATGAMAQQVCRTGIPQSTPATDFTNHGDGTITHKPTGLMWKQCVEGWGGIDCATGKWVKHTWQEALQLADDHSFAGHNDWRLPNIKELASIVEQSCYGPAINLSVFPNSPRSDVWSGSPCAFSLGCAWYVNFEYGTDHYETGNRSLLALDSVRLVRGGQ